MKFLLLIVLYLSSTAFANFIPQNKVDGSAHNLSIFSEKEACEAHYSTACVRIPAGYNHEYHVLVDEIIDDRANPVLSKTDIEACISQENCEAKNRIKSCSGNKVPYMESDFSQISCSEVLSYPQISTGNKVVAEDAAKKATFEAAKTAAVNKEAAIQLALRSIDCGNRVKAAMVVQNASKSLTVAQIKSVNATYSEIKGLLETGSLVTARAEIVAVTPDGTLITAADKTEILSVLDACKP